MQRQIPAVKEEVVAGCAEGRVAIEQQVSVGPCPIRNGQKPFLVPEGRRATV